MEHQSNQKHTETMQRAQRAQSRAEMDYNIRIFQARGGRGVWCCVPQSIYIIVKGWHVTGYRFFSVGQASGTHLPA